MISENGYVFVILVVLIAGFLVMILFCILLTTVTWHIGEIKHKGMRKRNGDRK